MADGQSLGGEGVNDEIPAKGLPFVRRVSFSPLLIVASVCFASMNASFLTAMTMTTAANAIWLQYAAPAWVFLIGVGILGERASRADVMMLVTAIAGVSLILFFEPQSTSASPSLIQSAVSPVDRAVRASFARSGTPGVVALG